MAGPVIPGQLDNKTIQLKLAPRALLQLYVTNFYLRAGMTEDDFSQDFNHGQVCTIRTPRRSIIQNYNPRSGVDASSNEPGYAFTELTLDNLLTKGFPIYGSDSPENAMRYMRDFLLTIVGGIQEEADRIIYSTCARDYSLIADAGTGVLIEGSSPLKIVATEYNSTSDSFAELAAKEVIASKTGLSKDNVPFSDRYLALSPQAMGGTLGDSLFTTSQGAAMAPTSPGGELIEGVGFNFIRRFDFNIAETNVVTTQTGFGVASQFETNAWDTTTFLNGHVEGTPAIPVLSMTSTSPTGNFANLAKGQVVYFTQNSNQYFGIVLRVTGGDTILLKPYKGDGTELANGTSVGTVDVIIPTIGSINHAFHKEAVAFANRETIRPAAGSGAQRTFATWPGVPIGFEITTGDYNVDRFTQHNRASFMFGVNPPDYRKGLLLLSA